MFSRHGCSHFSSGGVQLRSGRSALLLQIATGEVLGEQSTGQRGAGRWCAGRAGRRRAARRVPVTASINNDAYQILNFITIYCRMKSCMYSLSSPTQKSSIFCLVCAKTKEVSAFWVKHSLFKFYLIWMLAYPACIRTEQTRSLLGVNHTSRLWQGVPSAAQEGRRRMPGLLTWLKSLQVKVQRNSGWEIVYFAFCRWRYAGRSFYVMVSRVNLWIWLSIYLCM
jgi:hypothetical protein